MDYTKEQSLAIRIPDENIMVSAGAGAGKTRVLVSRILREILDADHPVDLDRFLVMTFTEAAAAEMKERIAQALYDRLEKDPSDQRIRRQIRMAASAQISTIHSFCNQLIRLHYHELGIDPSYRIAEEGEKVLIRKKAMEDLLEASYEEGREDFLNLVEAFVPDHDDRKLEKLIEDLYTFSRCFPNAALWFDRTLDQVRALAEEEAIDRMADRLTEDLKKEAALCLRKIEDLVTSHAENMPDKHRDMLSGLEAWLKAFLETKGLGDLYAFLNDSSLPGLVRASKKDQVWAGYETSRSLHGQVKKLAEKLEPYSMDYDDAVKESRRTYPLLKELFRLSLSFEERYMQKKMEENVLDFDDLEHLALKLLTDHYSEEGEPLPSETAREMARRYQAVYVDEYQDISLIQETILKLISDPEINHIFTVGDVKQSIYRFRQARPDLFLDRYDRYRPVEDAEPGKTHDGIRIELLDNFRSGPNVLRLINYVFERLMTKDFGGVDYTDRTALRPGPGSPMSDDRTESEMLLFLKEDGDYPANPLLEAAMIAGKIKDLIGQGYHYQDMVILLRSTPDWMDPIGDYLQDQGIPVLCNSKSGFFRTREVRMILNYLAIVDNVYQDIPMAACMLSTIGHFSEEDMALLRIHGKKSGEDALYTIMKSYLEEGESETIREKLRTFLDLLHYFRERKKELPLSALLWEIYTRTGYYYDVSQLAGGDDRKEHLLILLKRAEEYEKTVFKGLFYFNRYMDQLQSYDVELGAAAAKARDAVYIMTMHKSKGLEYPVVFVSGLGKMFNTTDLNQPVLAHPRFGVGIDFIDTTLRYRHPSLMKRAIHAAMKKELLEEELRVLYVAMTRARNKLILTASVKEKALDDIEDPSDCKMRAANFMDWLLPALKDHPALASCLASRKAGQQVLPDEEGYFRLTLYRYDQLEEAFAKEDTVEDVRSFAQLLDSYVLPLDAGPVEQAFAREYPYRKATGMKRKYSVSELKKLSQTGLEGEEDRFDHVSREPEDLMPAFLQEKKEETGAAMRGTIVHRMMEDLPFGKIEDEEDLKVQIGSVTSPERPRIDMDWFLEGARAFLFSEEGELIRELDRQGQVRKELPFTLGIRKGPDAVEGETVLVQGIIDLCARSEEGWFLYDYKTDYVLPGQERILVDRYRTQMLYYKTALEQIDKTPVIKVCIYSFALRKFIPVEEEG